MGDFWKEMEGAFLGNNSSVDEYLGGKPLEGASFTSMRNLAEQYRQANALPLPQPAGARVRFVANLGSVLTYEDIPDPAVHGTVVTVKTAEGKRTDLNGRVFILWDDGKFRSILAEHLRLATTNKKRARSVRMVVSDLGNLASFFGTTASADELVHRATQDLWAVKKDGESYVIERLFNEDGAPLKV